MLWGWHCTMRRLHLSLLHSCCCCAGNKPLACLQLHPDLLQVPIAGGLNHTCPCTPVDGPVTAVLLHKGINLLV